MSLLDDLKKEAEKKEQQDGDESRKREQVVQRYKEVMRPRMLAVLKYLQEMIKQVERGGLEVTSFYKLPGLAEAVELEQKNYKVYVDSRSKPMRVGIQFECVAAAENTYEIRPASDASEFGRFLQTAQIDHSEWPIRTSQRKLVGAMFKVRPRIMSKILLEADIKNDRVMVATSNFEGLKVTRQNFAFQSIDEKWMDELGYYILRKKSTIGESKVSEQYREQLRMQLMQEQTEEAEAEQEEKAAALAETGFFDRVGQVMNTPISELSGRKADDPQQAEHEEKEQRRLFGQVRKVLTTPISELGKREEED